MLNETEILKILTKIFREIFDDNTLIPNNDTTAGDIALWDSLTHMILIDIIENKLAIKFSFEEVVNFYTVGDLVKCIENK